METPTITKSTRNGHLLLLCTLLFLFGNISFNLCAQQTAKYKIKVKTQVLGGLFADRAASGNDIFIKLMSKSSGTTLSTDYFLFGREPGPGKWTEPAFEYINKDIGVIDGISVKLGNIVILDPWGLEAVSIVRQIKENGEWMDDGSATFDIKSEILDRPSTFYALKNDITPARVSAVKKGPEQRDDKILTKVNYGGNFGSPSAQVGMKYTETWSSQKEVTVSKGRTSGSSSFLTLSYDSPATFVGTFGAQAGVAFDKTITEEETTVKTNFNSNTFDWSYNIPGNVGCFRKVEFKIPYGYQEYSAGGETFVVRKLHAEIIPRGIDKFLYIPSKNAAGNITPILLSDLTDNWLKFMDKDKADDIKRSELPKWIAEGWVVRTKGEVGGNVGSGNTTANKKKVAAAKGSKKKTAPLIKGEYRIKSKANGKFLHENGLGDKLVSTRQGGTGSYTRFIFIRQSDGSYKIKAKGSNRFLHLASNWDKMLSTRLDGPEENLRFILERQNDNSYRIKCKANDRYLHLAAKGDKLVSTRVGSTGNDTKFMLIKQDKTNKPK